MNLFKKTILYTDSDGSAKFKEEYIPFSEGNPQSQLTQLFQSGGYQMRYSPIGFKSEFHVTKTPQWVFILKGKMEIGLQDGTKRLFSEGECFFSNDVLPSNVEFDKNVHGHCSRQIGDEPLMTLFLRE